MARATRQRLTAQAREQLGEAEFEAARAELANLRLEQAVALALRDEYPSP